MATVRWIVVDDTDPRITYTGQWFQDNGSQDQIGNTFMHTLHGTNTNSSFSFSFYGTSVKILGTNPTKTSDNIGPNWDCYVDDLQIGTSTPVVDRRNNLVLCQSGSLSSGQHHVTLNVDAQGQTFWLDALQFVPGDDHAYDTAVSLIENTDQALEWSAGWTTMPGDEATKSTQVPNSSVRLNFTGTSVTWISRTSSEDLHPAGVASYIIDGGDQVPFNVPCVPQNATGDLFNQPCFTAPQLSPGLHNLVVTYQGDKTLAPLNLDYLLVANATLSHDFTPPPTYAASWGSQIVPNWKEILISSIIGGIIGVMVLFGLIAACFLYRRRRQMRLKSAKKLSIVSAYNPSILDPVTTLPTTYRNPYSVLPASASASGPSYHLQPPAAAHSRPFSLCSEGVSLYATYGGSVAGRTGGRTLYTTNPSRLSTSTCSDSDYVVVSPVPSTKDQEAPCYLQLPSDASHSRLPSAYPEAGSSYGAADHHASITKTKYAKTTRQLYPTNSNRLSTSTFSDYVIIAPTPSITDQEEPCYLQPPHEASHPRLLSPYPEAGSSHDVAADHNADITEPKGVKTTSKLDSNPRGTSTCSIRGVATPESSRKDDEARGYEQTDPRNSADIIPIYGSGGWVLLHWTQTQTH